MKTIRIVADLTYDEDVMHSGDDDTEARDWFFNSILKDELVLHSNEIGDEIGTVKIINVGEHWSDIT